MAKSVEYFFLFCFLTRLSKLSSGQHMQFRHSVGISGQVKRLICLCVYCFVALEIKLRDLCLLSKHSAIEKEYVLVCQCTRL